MSNKNGFNGLRGTCDMRNCSGGKGANLADMTNLGLPVHRAY